MIQWHEDCQDEEEDSSKSYIFFFPAVSEDDIRWRLSEEEEDDYNKILTICHSFSSAMPNNNNLKGEFMSL
jgi:hypothetical protein